MATRSPIPIGINPTTMGVPANWWLEAALRSEAAGFRTVWAWDHFMTFNRAEKPATSVLECWTLLSAAAARTRTIRVGSFVVNVMNRHPAVTARSAATVAAIAGSGERLELGMGIGGNPPEHHAYGLEWPEPKERAAILEEQVAVVRGLLAGGPFNYSGRFYQLTDAYAQPAPEPAPEIVIGAETPAGGRLAARVADAITTFAANWDGTIPVLLRALEEGGRKREDVRILVAVEVDEQTVGDLGAVAARWQERGADEVVVHWVKPDALDGVLAAAERAGLSG